MPKAEQTGLVSVAIGVNSAESDPVASFEYNYQIESPALVLLSPIGSTDGGTVDVLLRNIAIDPSKVKLRFGEQYASVDKIIYADDHEAHLIVHYPPSNARTVVVELTNDLNQKATGQFRYQTKRSVESRCLDGCGGKPELQQGLAILDPLLPEELPSWVWWNGALDEAPELLQQLASSPRRLILDSALGDPGFCLNLLASRIEAGQAVNDLNWLRLGSWHQTLAMVFDPPHRRDALGHVVKLDIDVEGNHPVQGLLLGSWIADRLGWELRHSQHNPDQSISTTFQRHDGTEVQMRVSPVPMGQPSIHPGQIVGLRLICKPDNQAAICVILCAESGGCMRLEAGGMASMELIEEVVPVQHLPVEADVSRQLEGGHDSTNPLLAAAAPLAAKLIS